MLCYKHNIRRLFFGKNGWFYHRYWLICLEQNCMARPVQFLPVSKESWGALHKERLVCWSGRYWFRLAVIPRDRKYFKWCHLVAHWWSFESQRDIDHAHILLLHIPRSSLWNRLAREKNPNIAFNSLEATLSGANARNIWYDIKGEAPAWISKGKIDKSCNRSSTETAGSLEAG